MSNNSNLTRSFVALASLGIAVGLGGCASVQEATGMGCGDVTATATDLMDDIRANTDATQTVAKSTYWANLVLDNSACFSDTDEAKAKSMLQLLENYS